MRTFLNFEARHVDRNLQIGYDDQASDRLGLARGLVSSFPAWGKFWEAESVGNGFSKSFVEAVNSAKADSDMKNIMQPMRNA